MYLKITNNTLKPTVEIIDDYDFEIIDDLSTVLDDNVIIVDTDDRIIYTLDSISREVLTENLPRQ